MGSGQRAPLPMSTRRGLIARLPYSNSYPAGHLLANKKGDAWPHVIGKLNANGFNNTSVSDLQHDNTCSKMTLLIVNVCAFANRTEKLPQHAGAMS